MNILEPLKIRFTQAEACKKYTLRRNSRQEKTFVLINMSNVKVYNYRPIQNGK